MWLAPHRSLIFCLAISTQKKKTNTKFCKTSLQHVGFALSQRFFEWSAQSAERVLILLVAEIQTTTWHVWNPLNDGINYHINWCKIFSHQPYPWVSLFRSPLHEKSRRSRSKPLPFPNLALVKRTPAMDMSLFKMVLSIWWMFNGHSSIISNKCMYIYIYIELCIHQGLMINETCRIRAPWWKTIRGVDSLKFLLPRWRKTEDWEHPQGVPLNQTSR